MILVELPRIYGHDAVDRFPYGAENCALEYIGPHINSILVNVNPEGLAWLKGDAKFYADGEADAAPKNIVDSAKRALATLKDL